MKIWRYQTNLWSKKTRGHGLRQEILGAVAGVIMSVVSMSGASATTYSDATPIAAEYTVFGTKWGAPVFGTGAAVTWSLIPTGTSASAEGAGTFTALADFMPAGFKSAIQAAFNAWSAVANITFTEVPDNGLPFNAAGAVGDIRLGGHFFDGVNGVLAHGYYPPPNGSSAAGDIHFDTSELWKTSFGGAGFDIFTVTAHEIGHAIGLDHSIVPGSLMNPYYTEAFHGLQADDIAGGQHIYGRAIVTTPQVPVPAALPLLMGGIAMLGFVGRRRRAA